MKKIIVALLAMLLSVSAYSQIKGISLGAGLSASNYDSPNATGATTAGGTGGFGFEIALSDHLPITLSPQIFLKQMGSNDFVSQNNILEGFESIDMNYAGLYLPITLDIGSSEGRFYTGIKLQANVFLDYAYESRARNLTGATLDPINTNAERFDYGLGVNFQLHSGDGYGIAFGYNWGLNKITFLDNVTAQIFGQNRGLFVEGVCTINN